MNVLEPFLCEQFIMVSVMFSWGIIVLWNYQLFWWYSYATRDNIFYSTTKLRSRDAKDELHLIEQKKTYWQSSYWIYYNVWMKVLRRNFFQLFFRKKYLSSIGYIKTNDNSKHQMIVFGTYKQWANREHQL